MEYMLVVLLLYFLPVLIAWGRKAKNRASIGVLNLFLGWTLIGWVIALMMAVKEK